MTNPTREQFEALRDDPFIDRVREQFEQDQVGGAIMDLEEETEE